MTKEVVDKYMQDLTVNDQWMKLFKIDKFPLPKFDGTHYYRFKNDFNEFVLPQITTKQTPFVLRQCLPVFI